MYVCMYRVIAVFLLMTYSPNSLQIAKKTAIL
jgi:hypothetical protein